MQTANDDQAFAASLGNSDCAQAIAARDWASTPLGAVRHWPAHLRTVVSLIARSPVAMALMWGREGTLVYNDAYAAIADDRHPAALGMSALEVWPEAADFNRRTLDAVLAGQSVVYRGESMRLTRNGRQETAWFDLDYSPACDAQGVPAGAIAMVLETTGHVLARSGMDQAVQALRQADERLHLAQEAGGVGTFSVELATDRLYGTRQFYRIFGIAEAESVNASVLEDLVVPEDARVRSSTGTRRSETAPLDVEYRIRRASDGQERWIARRAEFERNAAGAVVRLVGVVQDITERRATRQALEDSAQQFRTFAQALPNHVWTALPDGRLDWFNERTYEYSGVAPGTLDGMGWAALVHPDDIGATAARWAESLASGRNYETEYRIRRADGAWRWHLVRALPLHTVHGGISRWIGTNTDIHERKLEQAETARDRDRIWTLSQELMLICDLDGVIGAINPTAQRLLGWTEAQMLGRTLAEFIHPDDLPGTAAEIGKLRDGITTLAFENRYRAADGSYHLFSWTAVPDAGHIHAVGRDVTRERVTEDALRQAQKLEAIGQLTGGVAHDFNNVLAVIRTSIDLLRRVQLTDERRERFMNSISDAVSRASRLTGQLLAFARRQALQPAVFDAGQNTRAVSEMFRSLAGARVEIDIQLLELPCFIHADPSQFDTALVNLAVNARDAMDNRGKLTIQVNAADEIPGSALQPAVAGKFVSVSVTDTGTGIAPEHLTQIFEPFFTTKGVGHGTGLGLSQVFGFTRQSGGDIRVHSVPGHGSTFTLYLPRAARPGSTAQAEHADDPLALGEGGCILVVEDNLELAASVEQTLQALGYSTVAASSAERALEELEAGATRFAAVFSDVLMAGMSGIELGREIRARYGALPVVLSSGYSYVLAQSPDHGFTLLHKPYSLDDLAQVLHEAIHAGRAGYRPRRRALSLGLRGTATDGAGPEDARQDALDAMNVLDSEEEAAYDELTKLAASFCKTPIALVSLIDTDRQWFKSRVGLQARETPREHAFCAHAIQKPESTMIVSDASLDPRFAANPLVTGDPNIRFYAGAPLVTSTGHALGTLCVIDTEPRELDAKQLEILQFLAAQVVERLEKRRDAQGTGTKPAPL